MTTTSRQNNLILNQDWTRIYQTFRNADFKSYDFENLRRVIITYLRENYPEDFNDYIESSEYLALIDAVAFLGQSLAFRIDLASRENFIELAEKKESVLRIARMLSYNAKRNIASSGLLKFVTITTTEEILDSNGRNLSQQVISWNDPTNNDWLEQFILVLNSAMADNTEFGRSQGSQIIQGIKTEQYRFRTTSTDVPIFAFSKTVAGRRMAFELISTTFKDSEDIYEEQPTPGAQLGFIYRNDGKGPASANTGFYLLFKQGSLESADFEIETPTTNERLAVDPVNVNNDDLWLFALDSNGTQTDKWEQVSSLVGNNIAYNSIEKNIRNIYAVQTKDNDRVDLVFADGVYGNLPQGNFRIYYRVSNGLSYIIAPNELRGINITIPYRNKRGIAHTLTVGLALQYTVSNAAETESVESIRNRAPAVYYTQNRMITGEDYNLAPLVSSQEILKVKSINRTASGISRNYDIIDASGKYSSINVFADDGYLYREETEKVLNFKFASRIDIVNFVKQQLEPVVGSKGIYNFYLSRFNRTSLQEPRVVWNNVTTDVNSSTGYFTNNEFRVRVGEFSDIDLKYIVPGALVKLVPPDGKAFKGRDIVNLDINDADQTTKLWIKIIRVVGNGTENTPSGFGPITVNEEIPTTGDLKPFIDSIVPKFVIDFPPGLELEIINQIFQNRNFGLRYEIETTSWRIITAANLNLIDEFTFDKSGDVTNNNFDSSWLISFVKEVDQYIVTVRLTEYIFGSKEQNRFYFDSNERAYNEQTNLVGKDQVKILGINTKPRSTFPIINNLVFEIDDTVKFDDGYESSREIKVTFSDSDNDGIIDDPEIYNDAVGSETINDFIFFKEIINADGTREFLITDDNIKILRREAEVNLNDKVNYPEGQLIYFYDVNENIVKRVTGNVLTVALEYRGNKGRKNLKFQYIHNASTDRRIDPSSTNIIDIFLLTRSYDREFRNFLSDISSTEPEPPSTESLRISFGSKLGSIKSISDEIIYHSVKYKVLFGSAADDKLKAQFKVVKNPNRVINDNDLKVRVINAINDFFDINNWDFGDRFYLAELVTYVVQSTAPDISNMIILPRQTTQVFGSLFEIQSNPNEIFINGATVDDVSVVSAINAAEVRANPASIVNIT